jgi:cell division protein FtsB
MSTDAMIISWKDTRFRRGTLLALVLIAFALTVHEVFGDRGYFALRRRRAELLEMKEQVRKLQEENQRLEAEIKALKTDPKAIEKVAREQMKLAKPGEIIYVLPEKGEKGTGDRGHETPPNPAPADRAK